ncbi:MAG TPA: DNRLRE domain-containing protein [Vicinamibacterales bacterium]|nr:DNRLRE domain-containing protein [Vicinamibacterales bacterium]
MFQSVDARLRSRAGCVLASAVACLSVLCGTASAQTIVLNQPGSQVTDTTIRSGAYASTNYDNGVLLTRRSTDPDWERRTILKFDTQNTIARGTPITSATLTVTVRSGLGTTLRTISAYRITQPFQEAEATWTRRQSSYNWTTPGGTIAPDQFGAALVPATAGARVTIDLTALVQRTINGEFDSRYTRVLLKDAGTDSKDSYREYFPSEDVVVENRPTLTIVVGSPTVTPQPDPEPTQAPSGPATFKVLQWNIAQGYGTDGLSNIDRVVAFIAQQRPDVISFNEIMVRSTSSQPATIASKLRALTGDTWSYHWVQKSGAATGEGECVMTRFPVDGVDDFLLSVSRSVAMVRVTLNGRPLSLFSTHLDHQSSDTRLLQVRELVSWAATQMEQRIIAGDFNGWPGTPEQREMLLTYYDGWAVAKAAGTAVSFAGNPDGNTRNTRIDYVFQSRGATYLSIMGAQVFDLRNASGVKPSDHNPLIVTFQVQ